MTHDTTTPALRVGQRWAFKARNADEAATLTIVRIDATPNGTDIVHVSIEGVRLKNPHAPSGFAESVAHMPFSDAAVRKSVVSLIATDPNLPDFEEGYAQWRAAYNAGKGGYFTVTVQEGLDFIERSLNP